MCGRRLQKLELLVAGGSFGDVSFSAAIVEVQKLRAYLSAFWKVSISVFSYINRVWFSTLSFAFVLMASTVHACKKNLSYQAQVAATHPCFSLLIPSVQRNSKEASVSVGPLPLSLALLKLYLV